MFHVVFNFSSYWLSHLKLMLCSSFSSAQKLLRVQGGGRHLIKSIYGIMWVYKKGISFTRVWLTTYTYVMGIVPPTILETNLGAKVTHPRKYKRSLFHINIRENLPELEQ